MKKSSALALALLASFALPAGAQPAAPSPDAPAANVQAAAIPEIEVKAGEPLGRALDKANEAMKATGAKEAIVRLTTCETQTLPSIRAEGKITIIGCGDMPAGVGGKDDVARTKLVLEKSFIGTRPATFYTPVAFRGVTFEGIGNQGLEVLSSLTIENSVLTGLKGGFSTSDPTLIKFSPSSSAAAPEVVVKHSSFVNAAPIQMQGKGGKITFTKNKVNAKLSASQYALEANYSRSFTKSDFIGNNPTVS